MQKYQLYIGGAGADPLSREWIETVNPYSAGQPENIQVNATGGEADLSGLELEGAALLSENLTLDGALKPAARCR